jgi:DNA-binding response OmpR family regulator
MNTRDKPKILLAGNNKDINIQIYQILKTSSFLVESISNVHNIIKEALTNKHDILVITLGSEFRVEMLELIHIIKRTIPNSSIILVFDSLNSKEATILYKDNIRDFNMTPINKELLLFQIEKIFEEKYFKDEITISDMTLKPKERRLTINKKDIYLTENEYKFITLLIKYNGSILTREKVLRDIMDYNRDVCESAVDTMVSRIRNKLGKTSRNIIETVPRSGYRLGSKYTTEKKK